MNNLTPIMKETIYLIRQIKARIDTEPPQPQPSLKLFDPMRDGLLESGMHAATFLKNVSSAFILTKLLEGLCRVDRVLQASKKFDH